MGPTNAARSVVLELENSATVPQGPMQDVDEFNKQEGSATALPSFRWHPPRYIMIQISRTTRQDT